MRRSRKQTASSRASKHSAPASNQSKVRIIGGQWRRRMLPVHDVEGLRPTGDRIRETLFNWLAPEVHSAACLDLFAGTGALGLEALSRGAGSVQFIEKNAQAAAQLKENLLTLKADSASWHLHTGDSLQWLATEQAAKFNLVFLDPPFAGGFWQQCLEALVSKGLLADEALVYVESPVDESLSIPAWFESFKYLKAGAVEVQLLRFVG